MAGTSAQVGFVEPVRAYFGKAECSSITAVADSSGSLNSKYFTFHVPDSLVNSGNVGDDFYLWYNINGSGVDPMVSAHTGIEVAAATDASAATIAAATIAAIEAAADDYVKVFAGSSAAQFYIENLFIGATTATADGAAATAFTFAQAVVGSGIDLGSTSEDGSELTTETEVVQVRSSQTGSYVQDEINIGAAASISMGIQETTLDKYKLILGSVTGDVLSPVGGTDVVGMGEGKLFNSLFALGGRLILKPIGTASNDSSRNITFWRSAPKVNSINYNAEVQVMQIEFTAYVDKGINAKINYWMFGDSEQKGLEA